MGTDEAFGNALRDRFDAGRALWPTLAVEEEAFAAHLTQVGGGELPPSEHAASLYLAFACAEGARDAISALEAMSGEIVSRTTRRIDPSPAFAQDVHQVLLTRLLVQDDRPRPRIAEYAGRASLRSWLAAAALRTALNLKRSRDDVGHEELTSELGAAIEPCTPELTYLRARCKKETESALRAAVERLSPRDRMLLRLHFGQSATIDRLAAIYSVGRSTAARWLASAREALLEATREELCTRLKLSSTEFDSMVAFVRSDIDVAVAGLL